MSVMGILQQLEQADDRTNPCDEILLLFLAYGGHGTMWRVPLILPEAHENASGCPEQAFRGNRSRRDVWGHAIHD